MKETKEQRIVRIQREIDNGTYQLNIAAIADELVHIATTYGITQEFYKLHNQKFEE
jgi:anti-sigma28 factor (negative regulator of flagellin synthesis)